MKAKSKAGRYTEWVVITTAGLMWITTAATFGALWTPAETNTAVWLDAADATTILTSGSAVTNWVDKSGNARHVLQMTSTYQPTNGTRTINTLNTIDFDNGQALQTAGLATWLNSTKFHFIAVLEHDSNSGHHCYYLGTDSGGGGNAILHIGQDNGSNWKHAHFGNDASWSHTLNTAPMLAVNSFNNTGSEAFTNGTSIGTSGSPNAALNTSGPLSVGRPVGLYAGGDLGYYDGSIGEIICVTGDLPTGDRQVFEGYLAHKWGLEDELPTGHPYEDDPPTVPGDGTLFLFE